MKRKTIAFIISVLTITVMLAGCGSRAEATSDTKGAAEATSGMSAVEGFGSSDSNSKGLLNEINSKVESIFIAEDIEFETAPDFNTEEYNSIDDNGFKQVALEPLSTFAADVDTGSYCNFRRMINSGTDIESIPEGAVRVEEVLNYFDWDMTGAEEQGDFKIKYEIADSPWNTTKILLATIEATSESKTSDNNFVFLIDTSGSMSYDNDKIDLAAQSFKLLTETLNKNDTISVVTYAGDTTTLLKGCSGSDKKKINKAIDKAVDLCNGVGGGTNGSGGIEEAYKLASKYFIAGGNNRVIIASDGDMNLGVSSQSGLVDLIKGYKEDGIYLTTLGFGAGNYSDANMEQIADAGNGNYFYIDCIDEAERVLVQKMKQNTDVVAKDTKFQIEFNPAMVYSYRQIGYENRQMTASDFEDDTKDGGEVGAGQQVTIMYELVLGDGTQSGLKYQTAESNGSDELATIAIRYQNPNISGGKSTLLEFPIKDSTSVVSTDMYFAQGIAETVLLVRDSDYKDGSSYEDAVALLNEGAKTDKYRNELADLLNKALGKIRPTNINEVGANRDKYDHSANSSSTSGKNDKRTINNEKSLKFIVNTNTCNISDVMDLCEEVGINVLSSRKAESDTFDKAMELSIELPDENSLNNLMDMLNDYDVEYYTEK